jgi:catechol 2,3-dioxygenase
LDTVPATVISAIDHVAMQVRDLDAAINTATRVMGLHESDRSGDWVYLTHGARHHSLQLREGATDSVHHIALEAAGRDALTEIRSRVQRSDLPVVSEVPLGEAVSEGFAFEAPGGVILEVLVGMAEDQLPYAAAGVRPTRFGHVNVHAPDPEPLLHVLQGILDFRVSDRVRGGAFLRCNVDHHGIAVLPGPVSRLHHYAWEVESIADLGRLGDVLDAEGRHLVWGPLRHGVGRNIAAYFVDDAGLVVEFYADMQRIYDDESYVPQEWDMSGHRWWSLWTPLRPDGFTDHGLPFAPNSR